MGPRYIRNFVIIAHIDHGKSTLADRFLEITKTVEKRKLRAQFLDQMDLEREKGITIKMQPVRMQYVCAGEQYLLNLIDTPGHVDFSYEVSRALAAVEGAILLVDAAQGVQAQTIANYHLARAEGLMVIPVVNKIDLPGAEVEKAKMELAAITGFEPKMILGVSGKTGENVGVLLDAVVRAVPPPRIDKTDVPRALIFDSHFDSYRGVIAHVRVFGGGFRRGVKIATLATKIRAELLELGYFAPALTAADALDAGEIGYSATVMVSPTRIASGSFKPVAM
jgi:GTP-binding protein LepA